MASLSGMNMLACHTNVARHAFRSFNIKEVKLSQEVSVYVYVKTLAKINIHFFKGLKFGVIQ